MKIGEFRAAVDSLNWNRRDLSGATRQEFVAMDVRTRLERHIVIVTGLVPLVHARFADDLAPVSYTHLDTSAPGRPRVAPSSLARGRGGGLATTRRAQT